MSNRKHKWMLTIPLSLTLLLSFSVAVAQTTYAPQNSGDWSSFRNDLNRSGYNEDGGQANSAWQLWNFSTSASVWSSPAVVNDRVVVGCKDCHIYCLNASNGGVLWSFPTGHEVNSSPVVVDGFVYVGCDDGWVYCVNVSSGQPLWIVKVGGLVRSSAAVVEGLVYVGSGLSGLFCLNATDGETVWVFPTSQLVGSSPALSGGVVYFACDDFNVYAVNASDGREVWRQHTGSNTNSPCLYNGYLYIGSYEGYFWALNASTGAKIWKFASQDTIVSSAAAAYGYVYVGSNDGRVYCLDASDGRVVWQYLTGYWVCSSPAVSDGNVYVGSEDYNLYCFDAFTGALKWSYPTGSYVDSSPAVVNGRVYFGSHDYHVYALSLSDDPAQPMKPIGVKFGTSLFNFLSGVVLAGVISVTAVVAYRKKRENPMVAASAQPQPWFMRHLSVICALTITVFAAAYFLSIANPPLWAADEKTYSQMAYHMIRSGDYFFPWSYGEQAIWAGKPPLLMWLMSLAYQVFGVNVVAARFWIPLFGVLSLVTMFFLGKKLYSPQVGFAAIIVLGTFTTFYAFATHAMTDVPLVFFILASVYFGLAIPKGAVKYAALSGVFFGLALMTKQVGALLIPLILIIYYAAANRSLRFVVSKRFAAFWGLAMLIFLPYVAYMTLRFRDFLDCYFVYSIFNRATAPIEGHAGDALFYFNYLLTSENLLWVALLPPAAALIVYGMIVKRSKSDTLVFVWVAVVLGVFTLAQTKLFWYILPAMPAFALAIGNFLIWVHGNVKRRRGGKVEVALQ